MTTVAENNALTQQIAYPEIYTFYAGSVYSRFTSWNEDITIGSFVYLARPIKRSGFTQDTQMGKTTVDISAAVLTTFLQYLSTAPIAPVTVTITRLVLDDFTQSIVLFTGQVLGVTFKDRTVSARCEANSSLFNVLIPKIICKPNCNHKFCDAGCGLTLASYELESTVSAVSGNSLTINGLLATGHSYATGYVLLGEDSRFITKQTNDTIFLHMAFSSIASGDTVIVYPGCDGSYASCTLYGNLPKFQGMLTIPQRNPTLYGV